MLLFLSVWRQKNQYFNFHAGESNENSRVCATPTELYLIYLEIVLSHLVSQKSVRKNMADFGQIYVILTS